METKHYEQYAEIKRQIKALEEVADILKEQITEEIKNIPKQNIRFDYGTFQIKTKKSYIYSEELQKKEEDLKIEKIQAVERDEVHVNETHYLEFKPAKSE